ncbi:hypothetical protein [Salicola sp. Rm-C-2C1-2]|uniref:hypothetical protein n=1 Tax=Salicola sp. Rm-C-2C1-2 TaxID=3141321 RepID=UPI0032E37DDC
MPVSEETLERTQGYSIVRITESDAQGQPELKTYALWHESGGQLDEFADYIDAVRALNRLLFPLPGLPEETLHSMG